MSPIIFAVSLLFILSGCDQSGQGVSEQNKAVQSKILWTRSDLYEGKPISFTSPKQVMTLSYHSEGVTVSSSKGGTVDLDVTPPASILWRPNGKGVAINNGNGSGQMSNLIIVGDHASVMDGVEKKLKLYFFKHTGCRSEPTAVSVSAEGWSFDSAILWVRFENWDRKVMCDGDSVGFAQYDVDQGRVISHLSSLQAMYSFCVDSEFRELYGPNCSRHNRELHIRK